MFIGVDSCAICLGDSLVFKVFSEGFHGFCWVFVGGCIIFYTFANCSGDKAFWVQDIADSKRRNRIRNVKFPCFVYLVLLKVIFYF